MRSPADDLYFQWGMTRSGASCTIVVTMGNPHFGRRSLALSTRFLVAGFSLSELLPVTAIAALLLGLAIPSMNTMLQTHRTRSTVGSFVSALHLARSEAIKRSGRAVVCKSASGIACTPGGGWEQGWIVFHDRNNNAAFDPGERLVGQQGPVSGLRLAGNLPVANYVSYSASGSAKLTSGAFQAGTFTLCPVGGNNGADVRKIVLSGTGRPRTVNGSAADCR